MDYNLKSIFKIGYSEIPKSGVFGFIEPNKKKFILFESYNLRESFFRNVDQIKENSHLIPELTLDSSNLVYKLFCTTEDKDHRGIHLEMFARELESLGYSNYRRRKTYKRYHAKIEYVVEDDGHGNPSVRGVGVVLYNYYKEYGVVGLFEHMDQAKAFYERYYNHSGVILPVYSTNSLTRDYLLSK